ncbi:MAG: membrane protein insertase YidC [Schwartzia sp.]|nr:membrane protein insertase YidC [Schwartzia sp. (in: firmicutes)]
MDFFGSLLDPIVHLFQTGIDVIYQFLSGAGFPNYGAAIILLTILIKMALYPLTVKQIKSMKGMQELQPKMKKLQEQYKNNPQLLQQEMAKLYESAGINPLAGCLPLLVQMPILMAIYYALRDMTYTGDPSFFWIPSLSEADPLHILPVISAATTYVVSAQTTPSDGGSQAKVMMYTMPLFIGWISWNFAAGLVLYWITMNFVQGLQQWWMFRGEKKEENVSKGQKETKKSKKKDK